MTWIEFAACIDHPVDMFFVDERVADTAIAICHTCPVRSDCLQYAFDHREFEHGIYGGMTPRQRRNEWRRRGRRYRQPAA